MLCLDYLLSHWRRITCDSRAPWRSVLLGTVIAAAVSASGCIESETRKMVQYPLHVSISDGGDSEASGGISLDCDEHSDAARTSLSVGGGPPSFLHLGFDLGPDGELLARLLDGESVAGGGTRVRYLTPDGSEITRHIDTLALSGDIESDATLTITLSAAFDPADNTSPAPEASIVARGVLHVACGGPGSAYIDEHDMLHSPSRCADIEAWCDSKRALLGLE